VGQVVVPEQENARGDDQKKDDEFQNVFSVH